MKKHVEDLAIDLDMDEAFVPGLRRGFAIVPVTPRSGEPDTDFRRRIRESLKAIRAAKLVTGQCDQGGERYFWAAMSESPERRRRAQFAGKAKRLVLEMEGDRGILDVQFGTGNLWYNGMRFAYRAPRRNHRRCWMDPPAKPRTPTWGHGSSTRSLRSGTRSGNHSTEAQRDSFTPKTNQPWGTCMQSPGTLGDWRLMRSSYSSRTSNESEFTPLTRHSWCSSKR